MIARSHTQFYNVHDGSGLRCPDWCPCAICQHPLQEDRARPLFDPGWQHLDPAYHTDNGRPVCSECIDELDLFDGDIVLANAWAEQPAQA
jgi:hypothetical protein